MNVLRLKLILITSLVLALSGGGMALANEGDQKPPTVKYLADGGHANQNMDGMDMSGKDKNMDMSGSDSHEAMPGMEEKPLKEAPPNAKVLGTYGAVNAAFIIIGVWNKWFRRKEDLNVNSKK